MVRFVRRCCHSSFATGALSSLLLSRYSGLCNKEPNSSAAIYIIGVHREGSIGLLVKPPESPTSIGGVVSLFFNGANGRVMYNKAASALTTSFLNGRIGASLGCLSPRVPPITRVRNISLAARNMVAVDQILRCTGDCLGSSSVCTS